MSVKRDLPPYPWSGIWETAERIWWAYGTGEPKRVLGGGEVKTVAEARALLESLSAAERNGCAAGRQT